MIRSRGSVGDDNERIPIGRFDTTAEDETRRLRILHVRTQRQRLQQLKERRKQLEKLIKDKNTEKRELMRQFTRLRKEYPDDEKADEVGQDLLDRVDEIYHEQDSLLDTITRDIDFTEGFIRNDLEQQAINAVQNRVKYRPLLKELRETIAFKHNLGRRWNPRRRGYDYLGIDNLHPPAIEDIGNFVSNLPQAKLQEHYQRGSGLSLPPLSPYL